MHTTSKYLNTSKVSIKYLNNRGENVSPYIRMWNIRKKSHKKPFTLTHDLTFSYMALNISTRYTVQDKITEHVCFVSNQLVFYCYMLVLIQCKANF
jgi:hypothetical protein